MTHYDGMREAHKNADAERHEAQIAAAKKLKAENRTITAPCGCSWTLPSGQIQSRCAEHREPSQPSQPAFDVEAANAVMADAMDGLDSRGYYGLVTNRLELVWAAAMKHMAALERQLAEATIARCRAIAEPCWRTPVEMPRAPEVALRAMETACDAFGDARKQPAFDAEEPDGFTRLNEENINLRAALRAIANAAGLDPGLEPDKIAEAVCGKLAELNEEIDALEKESDDEGLELGQAYQQIDALLAAAKQPKAAEAAGGKT